MITSVNGSSRPDKLAEINILRDLETAKPEEATESNKANLGSNMEVRKETEITIENESKPEFNYKELADKIQDVYENQGFSVEIDRDPETNKTIMKLVDKETEEVVQQIPPDVIIKIAQDLAASGETIGHVTNAKV